MNAHQRAAKLFTAAARDGLEGPTEEQVADAIHDAEENVWQDVHVLLLKSKHPELSDWLEKVRDRRTMDAHDAAVPEGFYEPDAERAQRIMEGRLA